MELLNCLLLLKSPSDLVSHDQDVKINVFFVYVTISKEVSVMLRLINPVMKSPALREHVHPKP